MKNTPKYLPSGDAINGFDSEGRMCFIGFISNAMDMSKQQPMVLGNNNDRDSPSLRNLGGNNFVRVYFFF